MTPSKAAVRPAWLAIAAGLLAALAWIVAAPPAQAAFTSAKCAGSDISGQGASFARDLHLLYNDRFKAPFCNGTPGAGIRDVTYIPTGSGSGRTAVTNRTLAPRFGMSDDPLDSTQKNQINTANDADPTNDGLIHQIPAALGAVAPLVNFPNNCDVSLINNTGPGLRTLEQDRTADGIPDGVIRVLFTKAEYESIWAADAGFAQWDDVFPDLTTDADCDKDIIRVVRFDSSGTTRTLKDYMHTIDSAEGWTTTYRTDNRIWPLPAGGSSTVAAGGQCGTTAAPGPLADSVDRLTSGCQAGNEFLIDALKATDGSIGYADLSTARNAGLAITPRTAVASPFDNDQYWTQVPNGAGTETFEDPSVGQFGFRTDGGKGSNCNNAAFQVLGGGTLPTSTLGDWNNVTTVNSPTGFGICATTYGLVFDDNATVWGPSAVEEAKARTVKDYWENIVSDDVQNNGLLQLNDYSPLPTSILTISRAGVASINWDKANSGGGTPPGGTPPGGTPPGGTPDPPDTTPSNNYSVGRKTIDSKKGTVTVQVRLPGAGRVAMSGEAGKIDVGSVALNANAAGTFDLTLKPSNAAKRVLKKKGKLKVDLTLVYTPTGGTAAERSTDATLKIKKKKKK